MIIAFIIILFVGFVFYLVTEIRDYKLLQNVTNLNRGTKSERDLVLKLLKSGISAKVIFHDLYLKNRNGTYTQIDLVVATNVGLIVFEVKEYNGWIYGTGHKPQWTQVLAYGKNKYRFYNPVMQNNKHISDLKKQTKQFEGIPFYSIVVFYGDCEFKDISFIPNGTYLIKPSRVQMVMKKILEENERAAYTDKREVVNILNEAVKNGENKQIQIQHINNISDMLGKDRVFE